MDKGEKGTRRLSLYIQPSDFQGAVFFCIESSHYYNKIVNLNGGIVLILAVHKGSNYISLFLPPPPSNNLD